MSDEGVGIHVIQRLIAAYQLPEQVQILDGGTLGVDLLYYLEGIENLLLIDAVEAHKEPGTLIRLEGDEVPAFLSIKISPHQLGVPDMLAAAKLKDVYPQRIVLWGVQPERLEIGLTFRQRWNPKSIRSSKTSSTNSRLGGIRWCPRRYLYKRLCSQQVNCKNQKTGPKRLVFWWI